VVLERIRERDRKLVKLAKRVRVLGTLSWPLSVEQAFIDSVARGDRQLPAPPPVTVDLGDVRDGLVSLRTDLDRANPLEAFLDRTALNLLRTVELLETAHTPRFTEISSELYGRPTDRLHPAAPSHLEGARHFVEQSICPGVPVPQAILSDEQAAQAIRDALTPYFGADSLPVELDPELASKASAGSRRVALRAGATFSSVAVRQLVEHEALVHTATKRAGQAQPVLTALGVSTARTTVAQEGLATLAELITDTMDLARLRRVALRIVAIQAALDGADFLQVFDLYLEAGQERGEAYYSAQRVFRGGDVRGRVAFTKDVVYLRGLSRVRTFLLQAVQAGRLGLPRVLFSGRMTLGDALELEPFFDDGTLRFGDVLPSWVGNTSCLAAYLTWSAFNERASLARISLDNFREPS
jgi:uncharacterized protein (TIGR02421 family)